MNPRSPCLESKGQRSRSRVTKTMPAWIFALLWVQASCSLPLASTRCHDRCTRDEDVLSGITCYSFKLDVSAGVTVQSLQNRVFRRNFTGKCLPLGGKILPVQIRRGDFSGGRGCTGTPAHSPCVRGCQVICPLACHSEISPQAKHIWLVRFPGCAGKPVNQCSRS